LATSVAVNVVQASRLRSIVLPSKPNALLGQTVDPISLIRPDGRATVVRFDRNVPTVLYYFSPSCGWCERNWENAKLLAEHANGRYRVVAIASETDLADVIDRHRLAFEVYGGVPASVRERLNLSGTPRTVVVSAQGQISHDWTGAFSDEVAVAIEEVFGLRLPGLSPIADFPATSH
jgi:hypothetical protein